MKPNIVRFYFIRDTGSQSWPCFNAAIDVIKVQFWGKFFFFYSTTFSSQLCVTKT